MPSTIYLRSGDEFTVKQPYAVALERWTARTDTAWQAEFTAMYWCDPKYCDGSDPAYRESLVTVDLSSVIAVERVDGLRAASIERARQYDPDHDAPGDDED